MGGGPGRSGAVRPGGISGRESGFVGSRGFGGYGGGATPVSMSNTAVKSSSADGTARESRGRVGRRRTLPFDESGFDEEWTVRSVESFFSNSYFKSHIKIRNRFMQRFVAT